MAVSTNTASSLLPDQRAELRLQAAQMATDQFDQNTRKLIDLLSSVDFSRSRLPREILNDRQLGKRMCRMEYSIQIQLVGKLEHSRLRLQANTRPLDERLINLALRFARYVRTGETTSATMAHEALIRGIRDIRCNFPQDPAIPPEKYVQINVEYLNQWINLLQWAEIYDSQAKSLAAQRQAHMQEVTQLEDSINKIATRIDTEPEFGDAFFHILDHDSPKDRSNWTPAQMELHLMLVDHRFKQFTLQMSNVSLTTLEQDQLAVKLKIDTLAQKLAAVPIVTDPDLLNKYRESMDNYIRDQAASDALLAEVLQYTDEMEDTLKHLEETSAANRQHSAAVEGARITTEKILMRDKIESDPDNQYQDSPNRYTYDN